VCGKGREEKKGHILTPYHPVMVPLRGTRARRALLTATSSSSAIININSRPCRSGSCESNRP
jgi:hypothetical protein